MHCRQRTQMWTTHTAYPTPMNMYNSHTTVFAITPHATPRLYLGAHVFSWCICVQSFKLLYMQHEHAFKQAVKKVHER